MTTVARTPSEVEQRLIAKLRRRGRWVGGEQIAAAVGAIGDPVPTNVGLATSAEPSRAERRATIAQDRQSDRPAPAAPPAKRRRRASRQQRRAWASERREREWQSRRAKELAEKEAQWITVPDPDGGEPLNWRRIPMPVRIMCKDMVSDTSGRAWRFHAAMCRSKTALGAIRRAALLPQTDGTTLRTWADLTARRIAALGLGLWHLSHRTRRRGPWHLIVRGIPIRALCWLLCHPSPGNRPPSYTSFCGHHRGTRSEIGKGQVGYLKELAAAGFLASQRHYPDAAPWEIGPAGYPMNRYWIAGEPGCTVDPEIRAELIALNREGWSSLREHPERSPFRRVLYTGDPAETGVPPPPD